MKNFLKRLTIIAFIAAIGLSTVSCNKIKGIFNDVVNKISGKSDSGVKDDGVKKDNDKKDADKGGNTIGGSGKFSLTGIPADYNGKYAVLAGITQNMNAVLYGFKSAKNEKLTLPRISNGSVTLPMWIVDIKDKSKTPDYKKYSGDDSTLALVVFIVDKENIDSKELYNSKTMISFQSVKFSKGGVQKDWKAGGKSNVNIFQFMNQ